MTDTTRQLFPLGQLVGTPAALAILRQHNVSSSELLERHRRGDWGDLAPADRQVNDLAVRQGLTILSAYRVGQQYVWIVTEADRQTTSLLLRHEY